MRENQIGGFFLNLHMVLEPVLFAPDCGSDDVKYDALEAGVNNVTNVAIASVIVDLSSTVCLSRLMRSQTADC